jgi:hypothetical protein
MTSLPSAGSRIPAGKLADRVGGPVLVMGDAGYDEERAGFQANGQHEPPVIVGVATPGDVREAMRFAAERGLPVAVQATGHSPAFPAREGMLVSTRRLREVDVDPAARRARIQAGARWQEVIQAAARYGLAPLSGSAPHVGATGYTLGGGLGLLARRYGYAADHVHGIDVVTADGQLRHVGPDSDADLFWALRGGRDNFGIVTGMEISLFPVTGLYGGGLYFPGNLAAEAAVDYLHWTEDVPDEMTSSIAVKPFPDAPAIPEPLRGRHLLHIRIAYLGDAGTGERLLRPLRGLGAPVLDTIRDMPYTDSGSIYAEPVVPMPYLGTSAMVSSLTGDQLRAVLHHAGPGSATPCILEIRHLGGALARRPEPGNAVGHRDARYLAAVLSRLRPSDDPAAVRVRHRQTLELLAPVSLGRNVNFDFGENTSPDEVRAAYDPGDYRLLGELKDRYDPANIFRINQNIPPAVYVPKP